MSELEKQLKDFDLRNQRMVSYNPQRKIFEEEINGRKQRFVFWSERRGEIEVAEIIEKYIEILINDQLQDEGCLDQTNGEYVPLEGYEKRYEELKRAKLRDYNIPSSNCRKGRIF